MRSVRFVGASGGAGTSTVALAYGLLSVEGSGSAVVASEDWEGLTAIAGVSSSAESSVPACSGVVLGDWGRREWSRRSIDLLSLDGGSVRHLTAWECDGPTLLVLRGPDYLGLRRALGSGLDFAGVVLVVEAGRSLGDRDVCDVLGRPIVARLEIDAAVGRAGDAGLMCSRVPRSLRALLKADRLVSS